VSSPSEFSNLHHFELYDFSAVRQGSCFAHGGNQNATGAISAAGVEVKVLIEVEHGLISEWGLIAQGNLPID
jgi:hypothetical protein